MKRLQSRSRSGVRPAPLRRGVISAAIATAAVCLNLGACSTSRDLAVSKGPIYALNANHWQATPADLNPAKNTDGVK